jgi:hypothetical protein
MNALSKQPPEARRWLRAEDGVLAAWTFALPAVGGWFGALGSASLGSINAGPQPLVGLAQLLAVAGAIAALLTRPPDQPGVRIGGQDAPRWVICGPLIGGLSLAADGAAGNLGLDIGGWFMGLAFLAILVGTMGADHLPVVQAPVRRLFTAPFILVSAAYFNGFAASFLGSIDIGQVVGSFAGADASFAAFVGVLLLGGMAAFYAMFVVAPRELADPEDAGFRWAIRFALFLASSLAGIGWLAVLAG